MNLYQSRLCKTRRRCAFAYKILLTDIIRQKLLCNTLGKITIKVRLNYKHPCALHLLNRADAQLFDISQYLLAVNVSEFRLAENLKPPLFHYKLSFFNLYLISSLLLPLAFASSFSILSLS